MQGCGAITVCRRGASRGTTTGNADEDDEGLREGGRAWVYGMRGVEGIQATEDHREANIIIPVL